MMNLITLCSKGDLRRLYLTIAFKLLITGLNQHLHFKLHIKALILIQG